MCSCWNLCLVFVLCIPYFAFHPGFLEVWVSTVYWSASGRSEYMLKLLLSRISVWDAKCIQSSVCLQVCPSSYFLDPFILLLCLLDMSSFSSTIILNFYVTLFFTPIWQVSSPILTQLSSFSMPVPEWLSIATENHGHRSPAPSMLLCGAVPCLLTTRDLLHLLSSNLQLCLYHLCSRKIHIIYATGI